jgi:hypothetical protein
MRISLYAIAIIALTSSGVMLATNSVRSTVDASEPNTVNIIDVDELQSKIDFDRLPVSEPVDMI